jgi:hypothetical protein
MSVFKIMSNVDDDDSGWDHCNQYWRNLVCDVRSKYPDWLVREDTYSLINQELQKYHGRLDNLDHRVSEIIFDSEEHKTWFLLRWL